ncbi:MAG: tRNA-specific 2-thiouridylase [Parcubacteria group bacterium Athens1014_10]|nr:MAG: tRNA-specific 2-thiouridylase [Parcubacteria group bacterium Athens1014_10]TSD04979.1 MAG: tRNA-specific 2-thiouridylase [Parcubacteria group bacterium Athens0714_12]
MIKKAEILKSNPPANFFRKKVVGGKKIIVGMSGGLDSSISLLLLKKQGWQPIGVSLKLPVWKDKKNLSRENACCKKEAVDIAKSICKKLNVPFYILDAEKDFKKEVVDYFISEVKNNRTPNPCVICNRHLKFKKLFEFAKKMKANFVATGHYAKLRFNPKTKKYELLMAKDKHKDQTYYLSFLPQKWLKKIIFPLSDYLKDEVYQLAKKEGFDFFFARKQSQDFCFAAGESLACFLQEEIGKKSGLITDAKGKKLGIHNGLHFYTIGQRKGLKLPDGPYFVKGFDISKNILIVTKNQKEIIQKEIILSPFHFISGELPKKKIELMAKVRYQQSLNKAAIFPPKKGKLKIIFKKAQRAVTPGQFCIFYLPSKASAKEGKGKVCLGGGVIN